MNVRGALVGLVAAGCLLSGTPGVAAKLEAGVLPATDLFQDGLIPRLRIELSAEARASLRSKPRTYVTATIREGAHVYTNVSIRLKGGPGSFRQLDDRPAFTVNFGRLAPGQKFHGLRKLHLNNSVQDTTYLSEKICREMFEAAGVPSPRAGHAVVDLEGRLLGLYVLVEGIDKQFLGRYFKDTKGNLYDGHSQNDVTQRMRTNSGESRKEQSALQALANAIREPDLQRRLTAVEKTLDLERFISFIAMEIIVCHWDGYALNRNNFRIYHDRDAERLVFLPQGLDQTFQRQNIQAFPPMVGAVAKAVFEIPQAAERYRARQLELLTNVLSVTPLAQHVSQVASNVDLVLQNIDPGASGSYLSRAGSFRRRIRQRLDGLKRQLSGTSSEDEYAQKMKLPGWESQVDRGDVVMREERGDNGHTWLHVRANAAGAGSWRARLALEPGRYRLEGMVKLQGVKLSEGDPKSGVGLRISRRKFSRKLTGDLGWTPLTFDFEVTPDKSEVELVCELRAEGGQAWFDLTTLQLLRRQ